MHDNNRFDVVIAVVGTVKLPLVSVVSLISVVFIRSVNFPFNDFVNVLFQEKIQMPQELFMLESLRLNKRKARSFYET